MTGRIEALTGHPETVQALVDADLAAARQMPNTVVTRLKNRTWHELEACYRALLDRAWQERASTARAATARAAAVEAHDEQTAIRRGGNR